MSATSTAVITEEELKIIQDKKKAYEDALAAGAANTAALAIEYFASFIGAMIGNISNVPPIVTAGCGPNPDPSNEHVKEGGGGWGGDTAGASTWDAVPMKDDPSLWKVVDKEGKNIAHKFASEVEADSYIKYHQCIQEGATVDPTPDPSPKPEPNPDGSAGPYAALGQPMPSTQRGPTTRHYASGKPDDQTIEKNVKNIKFKNYMYVVDVTMHTMEHNDTLSLKYGGTHMGSGWFDNTVDVYTGKTGLGTEKKHPSADLFLVKGPAVGDIREKRIRVAGIYYKDSNKCELWTNLGDKWVKQVEGANVGGFNPKSEINEAQLRIDGWKTQPTLHSALVYEIAGPK
jgi:hypothetical protein